MKIAFIDMIDWDYTPLTPVEQPLGGSQSAAIYLARELVARGHAVTLFNNTTRPGVYSGIDCPGMAGSIVPDQINGFDAAVVMNSATGRRFRAAGVKVPLALWSQHATDQPAVKPLADEEERRAWDRFFLVSQWQADSYAAQFGMRPERITVLRNAVSPPFLALARQRPPFFRTGAPPVLAYTSTPFRGLVVLLTAFPAIRAAIPDCRLRVYSSMGVYQVRDAADDYRILYDLARALPGAEYVGSLPQTALAPALAEADILAYPNTFAETSCISVMEAMAAGCLVVSSKLGALPETTAGFGILTDAVSDVVAMAREFSKALANVVRMARERPDAFEEGLRRQQTYARSAYSWATRAQEWEQALEQMCRRA
ncbi:MAG: glycosyltransferase family 4 protein [Stellaceae bacterium]